MAIIIIPFTFLRCIQNMQRDYVHVGTSSKRIYGLGYGITSPKCRQKWGSWLGEALFKSRLFFILAEVPNRIFLV